MLTALFIVLGLGFLILAHEAGHFFAAKRLKMKVDEFGIGFPPRMAAWKRGETEYSINWLPFGGFVKIAGENDRLTDETNAFATLSEEEKAKLFYFRPAWQRSMVILAGVLMNFLIGWALISFIFMIGTPHVVLVGGVQEGSPAAAVGLQEGDIIQGHTDAASFINFTKEREGQEIVLSVLRDGEERVFTVRLREGDAAKEGALGILLAEAGIERVPPHRAVLDGAKTTWHLTAATVAGFYDLLKNLVVRATVPAEIVGPVGIVSIAGSASGAGIIPLLQLIALISVNLAVLNLIPFPALDGGRFLLILIEKAKGSPLSKRVEATINGVGFLFLIILMVFITTRDVIRLF